MPASADTVIAGRKTSVHVLTEWGYRTWFVRRTVVRRSGRPSLNEQDSMRVKLQIAGTFFTYRRRL